MCLPVPGPVLGMFVLINLITVDLQASCANLTSQSGSVQSWELAGSEWASQGMEPVMLPQP